MVGLLVVQVTCRGRDGFLLIVAGKVRMADNNMGDESIVLDYYGHFSPFYFSRRSQYV